MLSVEGCLYDSHIPAGWSGVVQSASGVWGRKPPIRILAFPGREMPGSWRGEAPALGTCLAMEAEARGFLGSVSGKRSDN